MAGFEGRSDYSEFKWGVKIGVGKTNKDLQFYESFTFQGVKYSLYDSVYTYQTGASETDVGKIVKIYSTATEKKVRVVWLFRPAEICNFLGEYVPFWKELFLASGKGIGLSNVNPLVSQISIELFLLFLLFLILGVGDLI